MSSNVQIGLRNRKRVGSKHDKTGCLTCRQRRKKCMENTYPICGSCIRLNLECIREPTRKVYSQCRRSQNVAGQLPDAPTHPDSLLPLCFTPSTVGQGCAGLPLRRHAMRYYVTVLSQHLTVSEQFNSFLSTFLPMAMESQLLYDALVALASGHMARADRSYEVMALEARSNALGGLAAAIKKPSSLLTWNEINAAACLSFLVNDVGIDQRRGWHDHLKATKHFIMSAMATSSSGKLLSGPDAFKESADGQWILRNFAYHDIIGSVTLRKRPLLDGNYLSHITTNVDSYLGVATELLIFIAKISCLGQDTEQDEQNQQPMVVEDAQSKKTQISGTCASLELQLKAWSCPLNTPLGLAAVAYAYRSASLILVYRILRSQLGLSGSSNCENPISKNSLEDILQARVYTEVDSILTHVSDIPFGATPESPLLFPLFIAGGEATERGHIDATRTRLQLLLEKRRFQNVSQALDLLETLWMLRQGRIEATVDWTQILDASKSELLLT